MGLRDLGDLAGAREQLQLAVKVVDTCRLAFSSSIERTRLPSAC